MLSKITSDNEENRPILGKNTSALHYKLMRNSVKYILEEEYSIELSDIIFRKAGRLAGLEFPKKYITSNLKFSDFMEEIIKAFRRNKIGIITLEHCNLEKHEFIISMLESLEIICTCVTEDGVCTYNEGFLSGIFEFYFGNGFRVREIDCVSSGQKACRFIIRSDD